MKNKFITLTIYLIGYLIGTFVHFKIRTKIKVHLVAPHNTKFVSSGELYDESLSNKLFHEVKILCWVFTHPENHNSKSVHIKNLWGRRCNKLLFMSTEEDAVLGSVALPVENERVELWHKTLETYKYVSKYDLMLVECKKVKQFICLRFTNIIFTSLIGS